MRSENHRAQYRDPQGRRLKPTLSPSSVTRRSARTAQPAWPIIPSASTARGSGAPHKSTSGLPRELVISLACRSTTVGS
jgi:hypothetical protein